MNWKLIIIFALMGVGILIICYELLKLNRILRSGIRTRARKTGLTTIINNEGDKIDVPIIEFNDQNGRVIRTKMGTNMLNKRLHFDIIYDPRNPKHVILDHWTKQIPLLFGVIIVVLCILFLTVELANR